MTKLPEAGIIDNDNFHIAKIIPQFQQIFMLRSLLYISGTVSMPELAWLY